MKKFRFALFLPILFGQLLVFVFSVSAQETCPSSRQPRVLTTSVNRREYFYTPGFLSGRYPTNLDCHWIIQASDPRNKIQIFVYFSQMEDRLFTDCDDFMEIRDGSSYNSALIVQWCGTTNPLSATSSSDSLYLHFKTDPYFGSRGVNLSYTEYSFSYCPYDWLPSSDQVMCYHLVSPLFGSTWIQAQTHCTYDRSNLLSISNRDEYETVFTLFSKMDKFPWIGVYDAKEEGTFINVDRTPRKWPVSCGFTPGDGMCFPAFSSHDDKDCLFLDFTQGITFYGVDDCRTKRTFICKKRRDGSTIPYPPLDSDIVGGYVESAGWSPMYLWLLVLALILLLLIICVACVVKRVKQREQAKRQEAQSKNVLLVASANSQSPIPTSTNGMILAYDNGVVLQTKNDTKTYKPNVKKREEINETVFVAAEKKSNYRNNVQTTPVGYYVNGETQPSARANGINGNHNGKRATTILPPVEKFERPEVRALDNHSAISLDEFWQTIDASKIRHINVAESPPTEL